jgi:hypothetical protein
MKQTLLITLAFLSVTMLPAIQQVHADERYDGTISDTMCGKKHMFQGKTDAQCIEECIKGKASYALVAGPKIYTLIGQPQVIAPFAGKRVHIDGSAKNNTITVDAIQEIRSK